MVVGPVIIVAGPTASGKSRLGLKLAKQFRGSVVNADSLQVYRELKILTNRPSKYVEKIVSHIVNNSHNPTASILNKANGIKIFQQRYIS